MNEYISRGDVLKAFKLIVKNPNKDYQRGMQDTIDCLVPEVIADIPVADVQPVKRGRWIHDRGGYDGRDNWYHCSECNRTLNLICGMKLENYPYCHCGARMEGDI